MEILAYIIMGLGILAIVVAAVWIIIGAFKTGIGWGLFVLFCQFGALVWAITHWDEGKKPFLINLCGVALLIGGFFLLPKGSGFSTDFNRTQTAPAVTNNQFEQPFKPSSPRLPEPQRPSPGQPPVITQPQNLEQQLYTAAEQGDFNKVQTLLQQGANVNYTNNFGMTVLFAAAEGGRAKIVRLLIEKGLDVNAKSYTGYTALMAAVSNGRKNSTKALIESGADINAQTNSGQSVVSFAKQPEIIEMLRAAGAAGMLIPEQTTARTKLQELGVSYSEASFLTCAKQGKFDTLKLFLDAGIDPNTKSNDGVTALMYVCFHGNAELVDLLIKKGADVTARTRNGKTAMMIAIENKHPELIPLLKQAGATE